MVVSVDDLEHHYTCGYGSCDLQVRINVRRSSLLSSWQLHRKITYASVKQRRRTNADSRKTPSSGSTRQSKATRQSWWSPATIPPTPSICTSGLCTSWYVRNTFAAGSSRPIRLCQFVGQSEYQHLSLQPIWRLSVTGTSCFCHETCTEKLLLLHVAFSQVIEGPSKDGYLAANIHYWQSKFRREIRFNLDYPDASK